MGKARVTERGWTNVEHFQQGDNQLENWGVTGVPHVAIIDVNGNIAERGHPGKFDLENLLVEYASGAKFYEKPPPLKEGEFGCAEGHLMSYYDQPFPNGRGAEGLGCDTCRQGMKATDGYWTCGKCDYDICANCEPKRE